MRKALSQTGDTIVEVIIAVAVVATILAGAFVVTNRSTQAVRDSQEHAEALQLLQGQVELLRHAALNHGLTGATTSPFCLDASTFYDNADTNSACLVNNLYRLEIIQNAASSGQTTTFDLTATWDAINGNTDKVYLSYKVQIAP